MCEKQIMALGVSACRTWLDVSEMYFPIVIEAGGSRGSNKVAGSKISRRLECSDC